MDERNLVGTVQWFPEEKSYDNSISPYSILHINVSSETTLIFAGVLGCVSSLPDPSVWTEEKVELVWFYALLSLCLYL
ncbi:MAG: hypothetical protein LBV72_15530 [Tannerella sp.]|jgi:hypothetical protein|nr:hypothetical protein [Tannerella sp.]